jgi:hypothetical protein
MRRVALKSLGNLHRQLAGRHEHERLRRALLDIDARQDRQREGGCLAGAGLRLADDVRTREHVGNGRRLDRRRRFVAHVRERADQGFVQSQIAEGQWRGRGRRVGRHGGGILALPTAISLDILEWAPDLDDFTDSRRNNLHVPARRCALGCAA